MVVAFSGLVSTLPLGNGPVAMVLVPSLTVMEVASVTFQLSVTFVPGVTVLELEVKLLMVGGWLDGGGSEELPPPQPEIMKAVRKSMRTATQSCRARVEVTLFNLYCGEQKSRLIVSTCACYLEAAALEKVVINAYSGRPTALPGREKSERETFLNKFFLTRIDMVRARPALLLNPA